MFVSFFCARAEICVRFPTQIMGDMMVSQNINEGKAPITIQKVAYELEERLARLQQLSGLGMDLKVVWKPDPKKALYGEIKGNIIYIYEAILSKATDVLIHEFLDYCVSQAIEPYRMVTNKLINLVNEDAYREKERIVEALIRLLFEREVCP